MSETVSTCSEPVFEVVAPVGARRQSRAPSAPGLGDLSNKRIGFVWDSLFKGDLLFGAIAEELSKRCDGLQTVSYETFGDIHGPDERQVLAGLPTLLRKHRIDGVVAGIGA